MEKFKCAISFLTIFPVSSNIKDEKDFRQIMLFFPIVALILGIIYYVISSFVNYFINNILFSSIVYVVLSIICTGGLHYDGLSDSIDGLLSGREKDKILEIMRDPRIGSFGTLAIVVNILSKLAIVNVYFQYEIIYFAIFSVIFSRTMQVVYAYLGKYAKENGMGNYFIAKIDDNILKTAVFSASFISIILSLFASGYSFYFALRLILITTFISFFLMMIIKRRIDKKLNGITGDILGLVAELGENIYMYVMFIVYNNMA